MLLTLYVYAFPAKCRCIALLATALLTSARNWLSARYIRRHLRYLRSSLLSIIRTTKYSLWSAAIPSCCEVPISVARENIQTRESRGKHKFKALGNTSPALRYAGYVRCLVAIGLEPEHAARQAISVSLNLDLCSCASHA